MRLSKEEQLNALLEVSALIRGVPALIREVPSSILHLGLEWACLLLEGSLLLLEKEIRILEMELKMRIPLHEKGRESSLLHPYSLLKEMPRLLKTERAPRQTACHSPWKHGANQ